VVSLDRARQFALSLPGATEAPHFDMAAFRVAKKLFVTVPPDQAVLHLFLDEHEVPGLVAQHRKALEVLLWGDRVRGVRVHLKAAKEPMVFELIAESWARKAPKRLVNAFDLTAHLSEFANS
jgi:hypothetical protein